MKFEATEKPETPVDPRPSRDRNGAKSNITKRLSPGQQDLKGSTSKDQGGSLARPKKENQQDPKRSTSKDQGGAPARPKGEHQQGPRRSTSKDQGRAPARPKVEHQQGQGTARKNDLDHRKEAGPLQQLRVLGTGAMGIVHTE